MIKQALLTADSAFVQTGVAEPALVTLSPVSRRLAAVMVADVVGYSQLMSVDEDRTRDRVAGFVTELIDATLLGHGGRLVKRMGDGILAEFGSALDAVRCGLELQRHLRERQQGQDDAIWLRIGINTGDVIVDERDIYGHVINVAAGLESVAHPGSICVSRSIYDQSRGQPGLHFTDRGLHRLKSIDDPIRVYDVSYGRTVVHRQLRLSWRNVRLAAVVLGALLVTGFYTGRPKSEFQANSILVLPFRDLSSAGDDYFSDAITDDITTDLSRLSHAFVIATTTALTYKGRPLDVRTIGRDCEVRYVLDGTIRRNERMIQINVQLIDAGTGHNLWADRFTYETDDLSKLEEAITSRVGASLEIKEARGHPNLQGNNFAADEQSLDERLRAMSFVMNPTPASYFTAREDVQKCLRIDPNSSKCLSLLARIIMSDYLNSWNDVGLADVDLAEAAAKRALELDPSDAGAYYAQGLIARVRGDHQRALAEMKKAVGLNPNLVVAHAQMANAYLFLGRIQDAITAGKTAIRLSPKDPSIGVFYWVVGRAYFVLENYKEAILWLSKSVQARPNLWYSKAWLISARELDKEHALSKAEVAQFKHEFTGYNLARIKQIYTKEAQYQNPAIDRARINLFSGLESAGLD